MRIPRLFTDPDRSPYASIEFRAACSEIRNPDGSVVFRQDDVEVPAAWSQVACDVLAQKYFRKAGVPARLTAVRENGVPAWLWRSVADEAALAALPEAERSRRRAQREAGVRPAGRHLDLLGLEGRLLRFRGRRPRLLRRAALHAGDADGGAELAAVVQHRAALGLRHRRAGAGALLRRCQDRPSAGVVFRLRAAAAARLLHPEHRRRSGQRGRDHGPVGPRGAPVQVRLRHRHQLLARCAARTSRCRAAASRPA